MTIRLNDLYNEIGLPIEPKDIQTSKDNRDGRTTVIIEQVAPVIEVDKLSQEEVGSNIKSGYG